MKVLVVGSGGREHALCWKIGHAPTWCMPGNAGTVQVAFQAEGSSGDMSEILSFAQKNNIELVVIGPEDALEQGLADQLRRKNILVFGPSRRAAKLEWSKVYAKRFMKKYGIPTADFRVARTVNGVRGAVEKLGPIEAVLKADGLAYGKGVHVVQSEQELDRALSEFFWFRRFGDASNKLLLKSVLEGLRCRCMF
ncbi:hypothetical protein COU13_01315 [Candidatus Kaiserbacteria bacterium CG10_big_fil_rev_8_21_14_0_10_43_70]|uniref:ATP-grasp domain-containing protein n=1 Tax=Candidatus Kaiserbacteria bacterium CG10_big_fil_rev_8_21_14_0_10_43_70 TaxID=1974605 RepID=A0A2H0UIZ7_9BACT|nr:MAG: hypothetical protein COU13_01315 [Candidatus Kaiserbacteria bacterium CG10_big_fil_rev_8_21_14_0_10_43_70]